jgi:hypothetical protein
MQQMFGTLFKRFGRTRAVTVINRVAQSPDEGVHDPVFRNQPLRYMHPGVVCPTDLGFKDISACANCQNHAGVDGSRLYVRCAAIIPVEQVNEKQAGDEHGETTQPNAQG